MLLNGPLFNCSVSVILIIETKISYDNRNVKIEKLITSFISYMIS